MKRKLGNVIAIDGKTLRRSFDFVNDKSAIHILEPLNELKINAIKLLKNNGVFQGFFFQ